MGEPKPTLHDLSNLQREFPLNRERCTRVGLLNQAVYVLSIFQREFPLDQINFRQGWVSQNRHSAIYRILSGNSRFMVDSVSLVGKAKSTMSLKRVVVTPAVYPGLVQRDFPLHRNHWTFGG